MESPEAHFSFKGTGGGNRNETGTKDENSDELGHLRNLNN